MKSSRRKQTNPNRVAAGRDPSLAGPQPSSEANYPAPTPGAETDDASIPDNTNGNNMMFDHRNEESGENPHPRPASNESPRGDCEFPLDMSSGGDGGDSSPADAPPRHPQDMRRSPIPPAAYLGPNDNTSVDLHKRRGSADVRQPNDLKRPRLDVAEASKEREEETPRDFPTAYHRLGRELQETSADPSLTNGHMESSPGPAPSSRDSTESPSRFNPEHHLPTKPSAAASFHQQSSSPSAYPDYGPSSHHLPPPPLSGSSKSNKEGSVGDSQSGPGTPNNNNNNSSKSDRIFHMDAYCDLCDREFCNKYFLKTHKANKHGIYEDNSPPASSVPLPFPGMMMPQDPLMSFNFKMDNMKPPLSQGSSEPLAPWSFKLDPTSQPKKPQEGSSRPADSPSLPLFPMPMPFPPSMDSHRPSSKSSSERGGDKSVSGSSHSSNPNSNNPESTAAPSSSGNNNTSNSTSILTSITNSIKSNTNSNSNPPATDPSMEDYCHICQKHFCNKYYLKKHKQDVHGIAPETPPNSTNKRSRSSASSASNNLLDHPLGLSSHSATSPFNLPQPLASLAGMHGLSGMPGIPGMPGMAGLPGMPSMPNMPNMPPGVMVINPYSLPPMAIIPGPLPGQQLPPPPHHPMGMTPLPDSALLPPPTSSSASSSSSTSNHANSSPSASKPSPSIQDGGVHCNICSKEFCNEFYLQIHKESKHGIRRGSEDQMHARDKALPLVKDTKSEHGVPGRPSPPPLSRSMTPKSETSTSIALTSRSPNEHRSSSAASANSSQDERLMVCNLCSKEFNNKYLYRIHRIHDHGLNELVDPTLTENGEMPSKEDAMRSMNESLMRMAADASAVSHSSSFRESPQGNTVFSNSGSNKQSPLTQEQNAVCDICNKEMTNQYFLRLHKFNVHGIDPTTNEKYDSKKIGFPSSPSPSSKPKTPPSSGGGLPPSSPGQQPQPLNLTPHHPSKHPMLPFFPPKMDFKDMPPFADFGRDFHKFRDMPSFLNDTINNELFARSQNPARHMDLNFFGLPSLGKIPEDNVKLNFDPEAYCEICKKEFCSKYFLRTHKQNIHGIKSDPLPSSLPKNSSLDMDKMQTPLKPSMNNNQNNGGSNHISNNGRSRGGGQDPEKNSWRWKEPVNSSRVVCDICNKEVCNKYFLRTHKLKKHGIPLNAQSPSVSVSGSPVASDCDSASNASSLPEEKPSPLSLFRSSDPFNLPQMIPLPPSDSSRLTDKYQLKQHSYGHAGKVKDEFQPPMSNNNNNNIGDSQQSETCNICSRRFKSLKWLKDHILKDHHISPPATDAALDMRSSSSSSSTIITKSGVSYNNSNKDAPVYTCQVCRANFPAELSVQLHLIQEHNARVTLDTEPEPRHLPEQNLPSAERSNDTNMSSGNNSHRVAELTTQWGPRRKASPAIWSSNAAWRMKRYVCTRCDCGFSTPWLSSLLEHERVEHGIQSTRQVSSTEQSARMAFNPPNSPPAPPNCFRCSWCPAVFPTRAWGVAHVRHVHIRSRRDLKYLGRKGNGRSIYEKTSFQCSSCSFKTHFSSRLQRHVSLMHGRVSGKSNMGSSLKNARGFASGSMIDCASAGANLAPPTPAASSSSGFTNMNSVIMSTYGARTSITEPSTDRSLLAGATDVVVPAVNQGSTISSSTNVTQAHHQASNESLDSSPAHMSGDENDEMNDDDTTNNSPPSSLANGESQPQKDTPNDDDMYDDDDDDSALVSTSGVYQSIAASLLSAPPSDGGANGRRSMPDDSPSPPSTSDGENDAPSGREGAATFLQSFRHQIPLGSSAVEQHSPFKIAGQTSAASAVVGGL